MIARACDRRLVSMGSLAWFHSLSRLSLSEIILIVFVLFCFFAVRGPLTAVASPVAEHRLRTRRLSGHGSRAQPLRGMWDPPGVRTRLPLHRQADSQPLCHQESPTLIALRFEDVKD